MWVIELCADIGVIGAEPLIGGLNVPAVRTSNVELPGRRTLNVESGIKEGSELFQFKSTVSDFVDSK
jgi:hypothetical protein